MTQARPDTTARTDRTDLRAANVASEQTLCAREAAEFLFPAAGGAVIALGGIESAMLRGLVDQAEHAAGGRRVLFIQLRPAETVDGYVEQVIGALADAAKGLWPVWFTDVSFSPCRN